MTIQIVQTKEAFAKMLDGRQVGKELTEQEEHAAKRTNLLIVFGASDDLVELRGAINNEASARWRDTKVHIDPELPAMMDSACECGKECPYFQDLLAGKPWIQPQWDKGGVPWTYSTAIPNAKFKILDGDELYCIGLVIDLDEVKLQRELGEIGK